MPEAKHGVFYWNELMTRDVEAAVQFYRDVMGWQFDEVDMGEFIYWVAMLDGQPIAGIMGMTPDMGDEVLAHWLSYIAVDDIDARLTKAKAAGAQVLREPFDVPNVGRIAMIVDAGGGHIGWMTPTEMA